MRIAKTELTKLIACLGLLIGVGSEAGAQAVGYSISDANGHLYRFVLNTGVATDLGEVNYPADDEIEGLFSIGGELFGVGESNYASGGLYDLGLPPGMLVGRSRKLGSEAGAARNPVNGNVYNIQADDLLPEDTARSFLYRINTGNGQATFLGFDAMYADGLAINAGGTAFATDFRIDCALYRVNLTNGRLARVGGLGLGAANCTGFDSGAAFAANGTLWALREDGALYTVNTSNGSATFRAFITEGGARVPGDLEGFEIIP